MLGRIARTVTRRGLVVIPVVLALVVGVVALIRPVNMLASTCAVITLVSGGLHQPTNPTSAVSRADEFWVRFMRPLLSHK